MPAAKSPLSIYKLESSDELQMGRHAVRLIEKEHNPKTEEKKGNKQPPKSFVTHLLDLSKYDNASKRKRQRKNWLIFDKVK